MELLLGAGRDRTRRIAINGRADWADLVTLDSNPAHEPDVLHDLEELPYPFEDGSVDEIHAYEVLEHTGAQGNARFFFEQFAEFWRILRPGGFLAATMPSWRSMWAWGDPSHKRVLTSGTLVFLSQAEYDRQVGKTPMSDFRHIYRADFEVVPGGVVEDADKFWFVIQAVKPARIFPLTVKSDSSSLLADNLAPAK